MEGQFAGSGQDTCGQPPHRGQVRGHRELSSQEMTQVVSLLMLAHRARQGDLMLFHLGVQDLVAKKKEK